MLFISFELFIILSIVWCLYWVSNHRTQNLMLLAASYIFCGFRDWHFLFLILISFDGALAQSFNYFQF